VKINLPRILGLGNGQAPGLDFKEFLRYHINMGNILIVEDDALLVKVYSTRLKADGHKVFTADNGLEGLEKAQENIPDVILLDIMMPKMSGLDVLKKLKENTETANIPVLVYSNLAKDEEIAEARKLGAEEFLTKANCTPQEVVAKIEEYLNKSQITSTK